MARFRIIEDDDYDWGPYITVGERRQKATHAAAKLRSALPVVISGPQIAKTFWGKSWCANLERYSDYANRLPRGRTYLRSGCVVDLRIEKGNVSALVSGTVLYQVKVKVSPIANRRWKAICEDCSGAIDSLVELLEGRFSKSTMERLCQEGTGMFPLPAEIRFTCSCPDSARMCKHVAAVLYGIGARVDKEPELLFVLRNVDQKELITNAGARAKSIKTGRMLESGDLSEIFGIDIVQPVMGKGHEHTKHKKRKR
jgi:uncharacterized Zn finger protein